MLFGKRWWVAFRIVNSVIDSWDAWLGDLALKGVDPRLWDLNQMLAAYEAAVRQGAKDEAEWDRIRSQLYAEPSDVRKARLAAVAAGLPATAAPVRVGLSLASVESLLGEAAAADAQYGAA